LKRITPSGERRAPMMIVRPSTSRPLASTDRSEK
jgi:hypothetical protein